MQKWGYCEPVCTGPLKALLLHPLTKLQFNNHHLTRNDQSCFFAKLALCLTNLQGFTRVPCSVFSPVHSHLKFFLLCRCRHGCADNGKRLEAVGGRHEKKVRNPKAPNDFHVSTLSVRDCATVSLESLTQPLDSLKPVCKIKIRQLKVDPEEVQLLF